MTTTVPNPEQVEEFVGRLVNDLATATAMRLVTVGDAVGLWRALAESPATSDELASRANASERYCREWLAAMHTVGYIDHDAGVYTLPAHVVPALVDEGGPMFFGGALEMLEGTAPIFDELCDAFRTGGGVPQSSFSSHFYNGMARFTGCWFDNALVDVALPLVPDSLALLEAGCDLADVGTGAGHALITLAERFPNSRFVGYDAFPAHVEMATRAAKEAGVEGRVRFELLDASGGLPGQYDLITTFDVVHDAIDPAGLLASISAALRPGGRYLCMDINASHEVADNVGAIGAFYYSISVQYCMTTSLAHGGTGLGTCGFNPSVAEAMAADAGFATWRRVELDDPFNNLYEATV
ncbi:MAG: class I SAM-dependent methyltransferase [Acidimicrobiales bacterium]|nr:class I SAM-dependent methyltransferase [Acidimicrobiales bacterium]